ncbi:MAG: XdhC family protein, partial [Rhodospirillaceae bacterium]
MSEPDSDPSRHAAAVARQMLAWLDEGRRVAWAVVMSGSNHALSPPGRAMAVVEEGAGAAAGSLSRGCIEDSVIRQALRAIEDGEQR